MNDLKVEMGNLTKEVLDIEGYVEGTFNKEYRDALLLEDGLIQYRNKKSKDLGK